MSPLDARRDALISDGAVRIQRVFSSSVIENLAARLAQEGALRPGHRAGAGAAVGDLVGDGRPLGLIANQFLGPRARPVRAVLFDKSPESNWSVAWHQDRVIPVRERREVEGFGPWSMKDGVPHVAPPVELLSRMITLRLHLDHVDEDNAPLLVAKGSHRLGRVAASEAKTAAERMAVVTCLASAGDVWAYATLILHASARSARPGRRRVLQVDYSPDDLPGLEWLPI